MDVVVVQQVWGQCIDPCPGAPRSGNESPHGLAEIPSRKLWIFTQLRPSQSYMELCRIQTQTCWHPGFIPLVVVPEALRGCCALTLKSTGLGADHLDSDLGR